MTNEHEPQLYQFPILGDITRGALYAFLTLLLALIVGAIFNIYAWNSGRQTRAELVAEREARLTQREQDERSSAIATVSRCRQSIAGIQRANIVLEDLRADHRARAASARDLATADPTEELRRVHLTIARREERRAALLVDFPPVTKAKCDRLEKKLLGAKS